MGMLRRYSAMHNKIRALIDERQYTKAIELCFDYDKQLDLEQDTKEEKWFCSWQIAKCYAKMNLKQKAIYYCKKCFKYMDGVDDENNIHTLQLYAWVIEKQYPNKAINCYERCIYHCKNLLKYDNTNAELLCIYAVALHNQSKLNYNENRMNEAIRIFKNIKETAYLTESYKELYKILIHNNKHTDAYRILKKINDKAIKNELLNYAINI
jgi:tetratricopeptide (TPR) repeat protein